MVFFNSLFKALPQSIAKTAQSFDSFIKNVPQVVGGAVQGAAQSLDQFVKGIPKAITDLNKFVGDQVNVFTKAAGEGIDNLGRPVLKTVGSNLGTVATLGGVGIAASAVPLAAVAAVVLFMLRR